MVADPVLATFWRGPLCEARIRGHVAVVDSSGSLVASLGDPTIVISPRSCAKPLQALAFVRGAMDAIGAGSADLAVACASHSGDAVHVAAVSALLGRARAGPSDLACGPQPPLDEDALAALYAAGESPQRIHNNCSGKHAAMLATCAVAGWPLRGYEAPDHPCQRAVTGALATAFATDLADAARGVDGCGLPTYGIRLAALARGFAASLADPAFVRCQDAMAAHPHLVGGRGRFDTALLAEAGRTLTAKIGAAGVWVAVARPAGPAVAIKIDSGESEAMAPIAIATLQHLGMLPQDGLGELAAFGRPALRNWAGTVVGEIRTAAAEIASL